MALAYWRCIFGEEMFGSNSPTFNLGAKGEGNGIKPRREMSRVLRESCPFLTSSWTECRRMQPCHNTGLSHRAEQLPRIAVAKKWTERIRLFVFGCRIKSDKILYSLMADRHFRQANRWVTFMFSSMAPHSFFRTLLGCWMAKAVPLLMSPILMDILATPAWQASSCSWN